MEKTCRILREGRNNMQSARGRELGFVEGTCSGYVTTRNKGKNGFGFDPLFLIKRYNKTFGQLPPELKARISHRGRALKKFRKLLARVT